VPDDESEVEWPPEGLPEVEEAPETPHDDIMKRLLTYQRSLREGASPEEAAEIMRQGVSADPALVEASAAAESLAESLAEEAEPTEAEGSPEPEGEEAAGAEVGAEADTELEPADGEVDAGDRGEGAEVEPPAPEPETASWEAPAAEIDEPGASALDAGTPVEAPTEETVGDEFAWAESVVEPEPDTPVGESLELTTQAVEAASTPGAPGGSAHELEAGVGGLEDKLEGLAQRIAELRRSFQDMAVAADDRLANLAEEVERAKREQEDQEQE
jgi:hypothetical protein